MSFKALLLSGVMTVAMVMSSGCASTATGLSKSRLQGSSTPQTLKVTAPAGSVLAVVRYPAYVDASATEAYYSAFGQSAIGGNLSGFNTDDPDARAVADSVILKSNYFALSLFKELASQLPEHTVLLSPHTIKLDEDGKLTSEPMTAAEEIANVVTVDFSAYTYPDPDKMMNSEPLTFGDLITPLVSVSTDHRAAVPTQGLRLSSAPLLARAARNGRNRASESLTLIQAGQFQPISKELDFVSHLNQDKPLNVSTQSLDDMSTTHSVQSYPIEKVKLDANALKALQTGQSGYVDPLAQNFSGPLANQILSIINATDVKRATMMGRAASIARFDDSLASLTLAGRSSPEYQARLRYAERLLDAERNYLSVQSLRLFDGIQNGEIGAQVQDMLSAEYGILEQRRDLARRQNTATALAVLGAVAAGAAISSSGSSDQGPSYGEMIAIDALIQGAIFAAQHAYTTSKRSSMVGDNYLNSIIPALEEQTSVQVSLIDSNETITAIRHEDLSEKLQDIYNQSQRSMDVVATRCAFKDNVTEQTGTWLGICSDGVANGQGVGVLRRDDGTSLEYYGYAQNGQPEGSGFMITHDSKESRSFEGMFTNGRPDGVVRVSQPGKRRALRKYRQGQDVGAAPSGSQLVSPFLNKGVSPKVISPEAKLLGIAPSGVMMIDSDK